MRGHIRLLAVFSLAIGLAFIAPIASAKAAPAPGRSPASVAAPAAVTCTGSGCDGTNPETTGCAASAITAEFANIYYQGVIVGTVELRYSTTCRTAWARIYSTTYNRMDATVHRNSDGKIALCSGIASWVSGLGYSCYSPQLYDHNSAGTVTSYAQGSVGPSSEYRTSSY